jgi:hypothetical protein
MSKTASYSSSKGTSPILDYPVWLVIIFQFLVGFEFVFHDVLLT